PSSRCALSPLGATAAPTLAGDGLSGGLRAQARLASGADPLAPAAVLRERDPTPPGGGTEERGERVLGTLFRPRAPGRTGRRRERLETSRSLAQASPRPPLTCYPCGRSKMLPMCRAVPGGSGSGAVLRPLTWGMGRGRLPLISRIILETGRRSRRPAGRRPGRLMSEPILKIVNLHAVVAEDQTEILRGVDLELPRGQVHAIMG